MRNRPAIQDDTCPEGGSTEVEVQHGEQLRDEQAGDVDGGG